MFANVKTPSFIFWPVGCGDSTTIAISDTENFQIDLNDTAMAEADDNKKIPLVDELVAELPRRNGKPYLSCFALTHPDLDHCRGFQPGKPGRSNNSKRSSPNPTAPWRS